MRLNTALLNTIGAAALLLGAQIAAAGTVTATATIDWSGLNITFVPGYTLSGQNSSATVFGDIGDFQSSADWTTSLLASASAVHINAAASADASTLNTMATINGGPAASEGAESFRSGTITVSGNGILFVTVPATLSASITGYVPGDFAFVSAQS